ncbi:hypothetical protein [Streptomyces sp. AC495_CC817]|uniref:hypothetical protein n=1 Tax=Streptomyces sp. AC495_CC817 TaxID=2823900 RepID=UPI001C277B43|nr:hypothetical protein [Streptomyces sp. AC495_CC817]
MPIPSQQSRAERMLIVRIAICLGLAMLLLVGAWSNSHGESGVGTTLCLATGMHASDAAGAHETPVVDAAPSDTGAVGLCAAIVFLLVLLLLRVGGAGRWIATGRTVTASAPPRAGPSAVRTALTLTQLSISRT